MNTSRRLFVQLSLSLGLTIFSGTAICSELFTNYSWGGVTYPTLHGAEEALRNESFIGAAHYTYQYTWNNGLLRKYNHTPTPNYVEDPKLVYSSSPGIACDNSPLNDLYGNDRCSNVPSNQCCSSEENWWAAVQTTWPGIDCPLIQTGQGSWVPDGSIHQIGYPMKLPEEIIMLQARYSKVIDAEFPPGQHPLCGRNHDFILRAISPGNCPGGYSTFGLLSGPEPVCYTLNLANINVFGAKVAEPSPNSCPIGNPCHPATGDKTLAEADFNSSTLPFSRHYHSFQVYPDIAAMGKGWSHTYSGRILVESNTIKVIDGEGDVERFECADDPTCSTYVSESESGNVLRPISGGWEVYFKSGETRQYDSSGKLILITNRSSKYREVIITYNPDGNVEEVIDQNGRSLQFNYNTNNLVDSITLPDGQQIVYDYEIPATDTTNNPNYNLVKATREDLTERQYLYEDKDGQSADRYVNLLTGIIDENGIEFATYTYDDAARVTSSEHGGSAGRIDLNYTKRSGESFDWSITEVTMPLGEVVTYDMEPGPFRKVTDIEDSRGDVTMTYDATTSWRTSKTDREGHQTTYTYDNLHEISRTEAVGTTDARVIETDWDNAINRVSEIREPGSTTTFTHNTRGQVLTKTIEDTATLATRTWTYTYHETPSLGPLIGQVETINGPRTDVSDITSHEYYTTDHASGDYLIGDLKAMVNALGNRTDYLKYDFNGRPLEIQDANNVLTVLTYHPRGWIDSRTTDGKTTSFAYDDVGNLTRVTQPDGSYIDYEYDDAHRLVAIADNYDNRVEYSLDAAGNRSSEKTYDNTNMLRRQLSRVYDTLNRLDKLIDGNNDQTQFGYDNNGNRTDTLDANMNMTSFEYDGLDRLSKTIDAILGETEMGYDDRDNLTSVTDPLGSVTQYTYDGLNNQIELDSPDTGTTTYEFDAAGNRTAATDARNIRVEYDYDALNRLTDVVYPDSTLDVGFTYDVGSNGKGRLTQMTDSLGTVDYTYDERGNLLSETRAIGVDQYVTSYAYNNADRLLQITYPSGMKIDYTLDATGRITAVDQTVNSVAESLASNIQYEPFGPAYSFNYGNGLTYSAIFDQDYELDQLQSGTDLDWQLGYDSVGNILTIADQNDTLLDQTFTYDDLYRLDTAQGGYPPEDFDYDANGNRKRYQNGVVDDAYTYETQSNRLATQNGWAFTRDAVGNRTEKLDGLGIGQLYEFADHNRLTQTSETDGLSDAVVGEYAYDGRGQRVSKTADGESTHFVYGPSGELIGEYVVGTGDSTEYVYLNGQVLALNRSSDTPQLVSKNVDNNDAGASFVGDWPSSTNVAGYFATDYQFLAPNSMTEGGVVVDNTDSGFTVTGTWPTSTAKPGYQGSNYQHHAPNGIPSGGTLIDDGDSSTSQVGTWPTSVNSQGYEGAHYSLHSAGIGENTYTWSLTGIPAGDYELYAKWTSNANRASNARYDVQHTGGTQSVTVNQKIDGGQWNLLGTFTIDAASEVVLSDDANGYVIADALQLIPASAAHNTATWEPNLSSGSYEVYAVWTEGTNRASNAAYSVNHVNGSTEVVVDQTQNGGTWQLLGTFDLDGISNVTLTDEANGYVIADAVYFVPENQPDNSFTWSTDTALTGIYEVFARWTAASNRPTNAVYRVTHATGIVDVAVDQTQNGGVWTSLGTFTLDAFSSVSLLKNDDGYVVADAIRVVGTVNQEHSGLFFVHTDHLGTPRRVTDDTQTVVWRWDSTAFGEWAADEDPDGDSMNFTLNLRFPGQYYDDESGLHHNYFRTYDPGTGRYIESDPIGLGGGLNTFGYVMNRPLQLVDKRGMSPFDNELFDSEPSPRNPIQEPIISWMCTEFGACPDNLTECENRCNNYQSICMGLSPFAGRAAGLAASAACTWITGGVGSPICISASVPASVIATLAIGSSCVEFRNRCIAGCQNQCE